MKGKIIPSAPFKSYEEIESLASKVAGKVDRIQIDVCDGKYVGSTSWPFTEYTKTDFEKLSQKKELDVYLPDWEDINYSVDLMVENPEKYIESFVAYGVDEIIIHFRTLKISPSPSLKEGESGQEKWGKILELAKNYDLNLVVAVDVNTDLIDFLRFAKENIGQINAFQVMGIEKIGFQGQEFSVDSLNIVKKLKENFPEKQVYFDGGINEETAEEIRDAGVDVFCVGSYLTKSNNFSENLNMLANLL